MGSSSPNRGENTKCLKPPPSLVSLLNLWGVFTFKYQWGVFTFKYQKQYEVLDG